MQDETGLRVLARNRADLLEDVARGFAGGGGFSLLDSHGNEVWRGGGNPANGDGGSIRVPVGTYGSLCLSAAAGEDLQGGGSAVERMAEALGKVLASSLEAELELNHLVDDHIATTNQLISLYNIIYGSGDSLDPADKFQIITSEACRQTQSEMAVLLIDDPAHRGLFFSPCGEGREAKALELLDLVGREKRSRIDPLHHIVFAPIAAGETPAGLLMTAGSRHPEGFKARDLKLVQAMADLAARFLLTARLQAQALQTLRLEQELEIAAHIQEMLVPRHQPDIPDLDVAAVCNPASRIGGDFYVLRPLPSGGLAFAFGDVAGKGIPAALVMAMARAAVVSLSGLHEEPGAALQRLNDALFDDLERVGKFVTLVLGRFDPSRGVLELANAGHSPVLHFPGNGAEPRLLTPGAPPLGVVPVLGAVTERLDLAGEGMLVVASDGLTEARSPDGAFFGLERLTAALVQGRGRSARDLASSALSAVDGFAAGAKQADDQTMLILRGRQAQ